MDIRQNFNIFKCEIWFQFFAFAGFCSPQQFSKKAKSLELCAIVRQNSFIMHLIYFRDSDLIKQNKQKWSVE